MRICSCACRHCWQLLQLSSAPKFKGSPVVLDPKVVHKYLDKVFGHPDLYSHDPSPTGLLCSSQAWPNAKLIPASAGPAQPSSKACKTFSCLLLCYSQPGSLLLECLCSRCPLSLFLRPSLCPCYRYFNFPIKYVTHSEWHLFY